MDMEQQALFELLKQAKAFMDENDITFYLFGGSCIGAIRHNGFIPWDNDIDIIMDRDNYRKLIEASGKLADEDFEFVCFENHEEYFRPFGQFSSKKDTYFLQSRVFNKGLCMGTIIDVFVLDYVPSSRMEEHMHNLLMYEETLGYYRLCRDEISEHAEEYYALVEEERQIGRKAVIDRLKEKVEQFSTEESDQMVTRFWVIKLRKYNKEWFGKPRYVDFEGVPMPVPANAEATLRAQYGNDWYNVPPQDGRKIKTFFHNHNISSNNYVDDVNNFIDNDAIEGLLENRKHYQVARLGKQIEMQKYKDQLLAHRLILEYKPETHADDYSALNPLIKKVKAFNNSGISQTLIDDEFVLGWMRWLTENGRYYDAAKVRTAFVSEDFSTDELSELDSLIDKLRILDEAIYESGVDEVRAAYYVIDDRYRKIVSSCIVARGRILMREGSGIPYPTDAKAFLEVCNTFLDTHPDNWDVLKQKADFIYSLDRRDEAYKIYEAVYKNSCNGMILLELKKRFGFK